MRKNILVWALAALLTLSLCAAASAEGTGLLDDLLTDLETASEKLWVGPLSYEISEDNQSIYIDKPAIAIDGDCSIAYNIYDSDSRPVNYFYSYEDRVAATPGYGGLFNVFVVVTDLQTGEQVTQNIGWHNLSWPYANSLTVGQASFALSEDRRSIYVDRPAIRCRSGSVTIAYNIYDSASNPFNYFYSTEQRVAVTPGYDGKFNVFIVVTDTGTGEQDIQNIGWQIIGNGEWPEIDWPVTVDGVIYDLIDDEVTVTGCEWQLSTLYIRSEVGGRPVLHIADRAFYKNTSLKGALVIPDTVLTIGDSAFFNCPFSKTLTLGKNLQSIGDHAFYNIWFSGSLIIPDKVVTIGVEAFAKCYFDGALTIGSSVTTIGDWCFKDCQFFAGGLTLGRSLKTIGREAFCNCKRLTGNLTLPSGIESIGQEAFKQCVKLSGALTLPNSLKELGDGAFSYCSGFSGRLTLSSGLTVIPKEAFMYCSGLSGALTVPEGVTDIRSYAFYGCSNLRGALSLPSSLEAIYDMAFWGLDGLTGTLTIPDKTHSVGQFAFAGCTGFTRLKLGSAVEGLGISAFDGCTGFSGRLLLPDSLIHISMAAFRDCSGFTGSLTIPQAVDFIGSQAFMNCSGLSGVVRIRTGCRVENEAFAGTSLTVQYEGWDY
ncbi:MAG: leucine-rich repeat domain-containing protein [Clostridia bacterium]|nr:leucine-rich repeat domain-containing protein [Clostridia bacterium]